MICKKQQCAPQENKHFDIENVRKKHVCKETSPKITEFWDWLVDDFGPCLRRQWEKTAEETSEGKHIFYTLGS